MNVFEMYEKYGVSPGEPYYGPRWGTFHYGLDMPAPIGVDIHSHMDARVKLMGFYDADKAGYICLEALDGSHCWLVAHVSQVNTAKPIGSLVKAGDWVGKTGNTGNSLGAHAHWEYYVGKYTNNITWMQQNNKTRDPLPIIKGATTDMTIWVKSITPILFKMKKPIMMYDFERNIELWESSLDILVTAKTNVVHGSTFYVPSDRADKNEPYGFKEQDLYNPENFEWGKEQPAEGLSDQDKKDLDTGRDFRKLVKAQ